MSANVGSVWRRVLSGAACGFFWGIGMRGWMRFISFDPEFTWSGTLFIVGGTTLAGAMTGLAYHRWRLSRGQRWRLLGFFFLPLGMAAGAVMVPSFVLGGIALGREQWHPWARILLALMAVGFQVFFLVNQTFPHGRTVWAIPIYAGFLAIETWAFSIIARPLDRSAEPFADTQRSLLVGGPD